VTRLSPSSSQPQQQPHGAFRREAVRVWGRLRHWWYSRQRQIDLNILWPVCVENAPNLEHAKAAFAYHALRDPAWLALGRENVVLFVNGLKIPPVRTDHMWSVGAALDRDLKQKPNEDRNPR